MSAALMPGRGPRTAARLPLAPLATSAFTLAAQLALTLPGVELPAPGYVIWPALMAVLGFAALAGRRAPESPSL